MNTPLPKPYRKVPIALFLDDIQFYEKTLGNGWTARVRDLVAADVKARKERQDAKLRAASSDQ